MHLYRYMTNIGTTLYLVRSTTYGPPIAGLHSAARAIFGPPGIFK